MDNIVLIGMPGCGKSSVGIQLAQLLDMAFVDTDDVLQAQQGNKLQPLIEEHGIDAFLAMEEACVAGLSCAHSVISTGGSVVYGPKAMRHLHACGTVVYIKLPFDVIEQRLSNLATRGVTLRPGQTLLDLYNERIPLYEREADIVFEADNVPVEKTAELLASRLADGADNGR